MHGVSAANLERASLYATDTLSTRLAFGPGVRARADCPCQTASPPEASACSPTVSAIPIWVRSFALWRLGIGLGFKVWDIGGSESDWALRFGPWELRIRLGIEVWGSGGSELD